MPLQHSIQSSCEGFWSRCWVERMFRELCRFLADLFPEFLTCRTCIRFLVACIIELHGQLSSGVLLFVNTVRKINWIKCVDISSTGSCAELWYSGYADTPDVSGAGYQHFNCRLVSCYFWIPRENEILGWWMWCDVLTCRSQVHGT